MVIYVFDGSLEGLLTAIFEFYERKPGKIQLVSQSRFEPVLLDEVLEVVSDEAKAKRVWDGLKKKISSDWQQRFYKTFLSESDESFKHCLISLVIFLTIRKAGKPITDIRQ